MLSAHKRSKPGRSGTFLTGGSYSRSSIRPWPWDYWSILIVASLRFRGSLASTSFGSDQRRPEESEAH